MNNTQETVVRRKKSAAVSFLCKKCVKCKKCASVCPIKNSEAKNDDILECYILKHMVVVMFIDVL